MLPDGNGINLLKLLRKEGVESSVIIISAQNALDFKLAGLSEGADDYLTKPFPLFELHARIKAIMRRRSPHKNNLVTFHDLSPDLESMECRLNGNLLNLNRKETSLLLYFINNKGRMLTRQAIAANL